MKIANRDEDAENVEEEDQREDIKVRRKEGKNGLGPEVLPGEKMKIRSSPFSPNFQNSVILFKCSALKEEKHECWLCKLFVVRFLCSLQCVHL